MVMNSKKVAIVGGGLVGCFASSLFAKAGWTVILLEKRPDFRRQPDEGGRSITLTISERGLNALANVGLDEKVQTSGIYLDGFCVHAPGAPQPRYIPYERGGNLTSVNRKRLHEILLNGAESYPNVTCHFGIRLLWIDTKSHGQMAICHTYCDQSGEHQEFEVNLVIGADGLHSAVRQHIASKAHVDIHQAYLPDGYLEFTIPSPQSRQLNGKYFHFWPRQNFMFAAIANAHMDNTFIVNLFASLEQFQRLQDPEMAIEFIQRNCPDLKPLLDVESMLRTFKGKPNRIAQIKCSRFHVGSNVVIVSDAAHAMLPFMGQGMNSGFEDCLALVGLLDKHPSDIGKALELYSKERVPQAHAICDLSLSNYSKLKDTYGRASFRYRAWADSTIRYYFPKQWPLVFTMVNSKGAKYSEAAAEQKRQNRAWTVATRLLIAVYSIGFLILLLATLTRFVEI